MYIARRALRVPVELRAFLELPGPEGQSVRMPARTVDLSSAGVGLIARRPLDSSQVVAVVVEDLTPSHRRQRRWRGRVVYDRAEGAGRRLGISFDRPDEGPSITFRMSVAGRGERRIRLDRGPLVEEFETGDGERGEKGRPGPDARRMTLFRGAALGGLTLDQVLKALYAGEVAGQAGQGPSLMDAGMMVPALVGLGAAGLITRMMERRDQEDRPVLSVGMGLLLGGLLSTVLDRATIGGPRPLAGWTHSPAELFTATGAALALASILARPAKGVMKTS